MIKIKKLNMSSYKAMIAQYGSPISKSDYDTLSDYAADRSIRISGFKDYVGNITTIIQIIDDIVLISHDFPQVLQHKRPVTLELDYGLGPDYATTRNHIIHLNAAYFSNIQILINDYREGVQEGRFVSNTDWHSIIRHELGHVVANIYHIDSLKCALKILNTYSRIKVMEYLSDHLSLYSTEYEDGREIIAESFSAYYGHTGNVFAYAFVEACKTLAKEADSYEIL